MWALNISNVQITLVVFLRKKSIRPYKGQILLFNDKIIDQFVPLKIASYSFATLKLEVLKDIFWLKDKILSDNFPDVA